MEQLRQEWRRVQREVQRARDAQEEAARRHLARQASPSRQVVYRGANAALFEDREGQNAEMAQPERVEAKSAAPAAAPARPTAAFDLRAPITRTALRRAVILSEIIGPPVALRPPKP